MVDGRECVIEVVRDDGLGERNPRFDFGGWRWRIPSDGLEGFDGVDYEVGYTEYAQYDGAALGGERVPPAVRSIEAEPSFDPAEARAEAESFFIPRRSYELHVSYMGRRRYCTGRQSGFSISAGNTWRRPALTWEVTCLDPMLYEESERSFDIAQARPCFGFPFLSFAAGKYTVPEGDDPQPAPGPAPRAAAPGAEPDHIAGFVTGVVSNRIRMENSGGTEAYPRFEVSASGPVSNPGIAIVGPDGEDLYSVGMALSMGAGDSLVLDFSTRPTTVTLNGANATHLVSAGSDLVLSVPVGEYFLELRADSGDAALSVEPAIREAHTAI